MNKLAFPSQSPNGQFNGGMTLRQVYANTAMQNILKNPGELLGSSTQMRMEVLLPLAELAFDIADAMLKAESNV